MSDRYSKVLENTNVTPKSTVKRHPWAGLLRDSALGKVCNIMTHWSKRRNPHTSASSFWRGTGWKTLVRVYQWGDPPRAAGRLTKTQKTSLYTFVVEIKSWDKAAPSGSKETFLCCFIYSVRLGNVFSLGKGKYIILKIAELQVLLHKVK